MRPRALRQGEILSAEELRALQRKGTALLLFDARGRKPYEIAHIEGAVLPLSIDYYRDAELFKAGILSSQPDADRELAQAMRQYPKDTAIVTYCGRDCQASTVLVLKLKELGFTNVKAMKEGIEVWEERGYPVVSGSIR
ncbi:MAG: rhodanese-like domain-containing protein [Candidatus Omnitrophica bacterium]|nr:rhodanese-like domain-containing protein [Candidatus Omnitrophota bacterium]